MSLEGGRGKGAGREGRGGEGRGGREGGRREGGEGGRGGMTVLHILIDHNIYITMTSRIT